MLNGQVWLPDEAALLSGAGFAFGTLTSVAIGGGGPMQPGGTRNGTPMAPPAVGPGSAARVFGGNNGLQILGQSALEWPVWWQSQHW